MINIFYQILKSKKVNILASLESLKVSQHAEGHAL